jgi:hypothetical protein
VTLHSRCTRVLTFQNFLLQLAVALSLYVAGMAVLRRQILKTSVHSDVLGH